MECFITKDGIEKKAKLEDILPLVGDATLYFVLRNANNSDVSLPCALAFMTDEMKNLVYRNLSKRIRGQIEKDVKDIEARYNGNDDTQTNSDSEDVMVEARSERDGYIQYQKAKLISCIGEIQGWRPIDPCENVVWRESKPKEAMTLVEQLINEIEDAFDSKSNSGCLRLYGYSKIPEDDVKSAFDTFQNRQNELKNIKILDINVKYLTAAALLFETGAIENLKITGEFNGTWPLFLENYRTLKSISICLDENKKLTELPSWIRNVVSLQSLSIDGSGIANIPVWIGDLQSLTELSINYHDMNVQILPDSIGNLKNLTELRISNLKTEKLPDSIGSLLSLKKFNLWDCDNLKTLPGSLGNLTNLEDIYLSGTSIEKLPDSIGSLTNLSKISLSDNKNLKYLPDNIGRLKNLVKLYFCGSGIEKLPNSIGSLSSLTEITLYCCGSINTLPDSLGNLTNLKQLYLYGTPIEKLPDSIGALTNLTNISLSDNKKIKYLPDSIGELKNLVRIDLSGSTIEKLPDTITNCSSLEEIDLRGITVNSSLDFSSTKITLIRSIELIPAKKTISYRSFCNCYYKLVETILMFNYKAIREGLLALEEELENYCDDFFKQGIRLLVDGTDAEIIKHILTLKIEREHDYYKKKLMEIALAGILDIQSGINPSHIIFRLAALVNIKNNPLDAACAKYIAGDYEALGNIDFKSAMQPEQESEEARFIERVIALSELACREGFLALDDHLDHDGIAAKDVFEYGLPLVIDGWKEEDIDAILDRLIAFETEPAKKNLALAKKDALKMIYGGDNPRIVLLTLLSYFDDSVKESLSFEDEWWRC